MPEVVERLRDLDGSQRIEAELGLGKCALDTVTAFSNEPNLGGGWLLFGLERQEDRSYTILGVDDPDRLQSELSTAATGFSCQLAHHRLRSLVPGASARSVVGRNDR